LVWKHGNDVKLWRHKQRTPNTNDHHMTLNQTPPWKFSAYATEEDRNVLRSSLKFNSQWSNHFLLWIYPWVRTSFPWFKHTFLFFVGNKQKPSFFILQKVFVHIFMLNYLRHFATSFIFFCSFYFLSIYV